MKCDKCGQEVNDDIAKRYENIQILHRISELYALRTMAAIIFIMLLSFSIVVSFSAIVLNNTRLFGDMSFFYIMTIFAGLLLAYVQYGYKLSYERLPSNYVIKKIHPFNFSITYEVQ